MLRATVFVSQKDPVNVLGYIASNVEKLSIKPSNGLKLMRLSTTADTCWMCGRRSEFSAGAIKGAVNTQVDTIEEPW